MNCEPGDIAIVVQGTNIGVIVEVICVSNYYGWPYWRVHWPARGWFPDGSSAIVTISSIHDARLRPMRPNDAPPAGARPENLTVEDPA